MTQQINLYDATLRPARDFLSLPNLALAMVAALLLTVALAVFGMMRGSDELRHFKAAEARLRQAQEQLTVLAVQQANRKPDPALGEALEATRQKLAAKQDILNRLKAGDFGDRQGFHAYFQGLAAVAADGLWLTGFAVEAGGKALEIRGRMLGESALPRYVEALRRQPAFAGREFSALNVSRVALEASRTEAKPDDKSAAPPGGKPAMPTVIEFTLTGNVAGEPEKRP